MDLCWCFVADPVRACERLPVLRKSSHSVVFELVQIYLNNIIIVSEYIIWREKTVTKAPSIIIPLNDYTHCNTDFKLTFPAIPNSAAALPYFCPYTTHNTNKETQTQAPIQNQIILRTQIPLQYWRKSTQFREENAPDRPEKCTNPQSVIWCVCVCVLCVCM